MNDIFHDSSQPTHDEGLRLTALDFALRQASLPYEEVEPIDVLTQARVFAAFLSGEEKDAPPVDGEISLDDNGASLSAALHPENLAPNPSLGTRRGEGLPTVGIRTYPFIEGGFHILGPGIFASADRNVINWEGENYVSQQPAEPTPDSTQASWPLEKRLRAQIDELIQRNESVRVRNDELHQQISDLGEMNHRQEATIRQFQGAQEDNLAEISRLVVRNKELETKLAAAEARVPSLEASIRVKNETIQQLRDEVTSVRDQLSRRGGALKQRGDTLAEGWNAALDAVLAGEIRLGVGETVRIVDVRNFVTGLRR